MRLRLCQFFSSSSGLTALGCIVIGMSQPWELWLKIVVTVILTPILVAATSSYFGVQQLWEWKCDGRGRGTRRGGSG